MKGRQRRPRDPHTVRTAVLDAAIELFAVHGFADTSLRDISRRSGISHPLILHHFGTKESLYTEVKRRVVEGYAQRFPAAAGACHKPIDMKIELQRIMTYLGENEAALRLCARTRVDGDYEVWPGEPNLFDLLEKRIGVAQEQGLLRDDLDARQLSIMVMGIVFFWLENRRHFTKRFGKPIANKTYLRTAVTMIEEGLQPRT